MRRSVILFMLASAGCGGEIADVPPSGYTAGGRCLVTTESAVATLTGVVPPEISRGTWSFGAAIVSVTRDTLRLDTCSPAADCVPSVTELRIVAKDLDLSALPKAYVHVDAQRRWDLTGSLTEHLARLTVRSVARWDGDPNPAPTGDRLLVALTNGTLEPIGEPGFTVEKVALDCAKGIADSFDSCPTRQPYAARFAATGGATVVAYMGTPATLPVAGGALRLRLLEAADAGCPDTYWRWGWTAIATP